MDDKVKKYKIDSVWNYQIEIKERSGQHVGIPKILRVEDLENGLIIISKNGRSQLDNKERIFELLNAKQQNLTLKEENEKLQSTIKEARKIIINHGDIILNQSEKLKLAVESIKDIATSQCYTIMDDGLYQTRNDLMQALTKIGQVE